jgi:hypothetical protein
MLFACIVEPNFMSNAPRKAFAVSIPPAIMIDVAPRRAPAAAPVPIASGWRAE